jgi:hypothetical protein
VLGFKVQHFVSGTRVIFENTHFPTLALGFKIYPGASGPQKMSRVVEYVHKIAKVKGATMSLHGRVKRDSRPASSDVGSKYRLKAEFAMNWWNHRG